MEVAMWKLQTYCNTKMLHYFAVAVADEGVLLRNAGIQTPIIVMNPEQSSFQQIHRLPA